MMKEDGLRSLPALIRTAIAAAWATRPRAAGSGFLAMTSK